MNRGSRSVVAIVVAALLAAHAPALAHDLADVQQNMFDQENYFQIKDEPAPDFRLQTAEGNPVALSDLRGKVVVLHFIYTSCPDFCPLHTEKIAEIQSMVNISPMRDQVVFATVTTDPARDTPEVMRAYGAARGLDPSNWLFLTSGPDAPEDTTRAIAERYGVEFTATDDGMQMHGVATFVIDQDGRWRGTFHGLEFNSTNLVVYVNALLNRNHHAAVTAVANGTGLTWQLAVGLGLIGGSAVVLLLARRRHVVSRQSEKSS